MQQTEPGRSRKPSWGRCPLSCVLNKEIGEERGEGLGEGRYEQEHGDETWQSV